MSAQLDDPARIPVMILCGGQGTRLREETEVRPKPMLEIGGRPMLWHIMKLYSTYGFKHFILCLGYKGHIIRDYFLNYNSYCTDMTVHLGRSGGVEYHNSHPEEDWCVTLADTGQATQTGARVAKGARYVTGDTFCFTYGDGLGSIDLAALLRFHRTHGRLGTITGVRPPGRFGELRAGSDGGAIEFNEKPQVSTGLINGGFGIFQRDFVNRYLTDRDDLVLEQEPLQRLAKDEQLMVFEHGGFWQCMDTYRELKLLEQLWESGDAPWKRWE